MVSQQLEKQTERNILMTDRDLRKLSRADLLELLLEQLKENEQLREELEAAQKQLGDRKILLENAGSIAEASLQLNGVFQAAEAACAQYIENIERLSARQEQLCAQMERETQAKCDRMVADAERQSQLYWNTVSRKVQEVTSSYAELRTILQQSHEQLPE